MSVTHKITLTLLVIVTIVLLLVTNELKSVRTAHDNYLKLYSECLQDYNSHTLKHKHKSTYRTIKL